MPRHRRTPEESAGLVRIARFVERAEMLFENAATGAVITTPDPRAR